MLGCVCHIEQCFEWHQDKDKDEDEDEQVAEVDGRAIDESFRARSLPVEVPLNSTGEIARGSRDVPRETDSAELPGAQATATMAASSANAESGEAGFGQALGSLPVAPPSPNRPQPVLHEEPFTEAGWSAAVYSGVYGEPVAGPAAVLAPASHGTALAAAAAAAGGSPPTGGGPASGGAAGGGEAAGVVSPRAGSRWARPLAQVSDLGRALLVAVATAAAGVVLAAAFLVAVWSYLHALLALGAEVQAAVGPPGGQVAVTSSGSGGNGMRSPWP